MPDFGKEKQTLVTDPIVRFEYDNTNEEIDSAMKSFQRRFMSKKSRMWIIAYVFILAAIIAGIIFNPTSIVLYVALAVCIFGFAFNITEKKRTRNKVIKSLEGMDPEKYACSIFRDKIEIETTIIKSESNDEDQKPLKSTFIFGDDLLNFSENNDSLLLIVNQRQIYCFPKRCMTEMQENTVRDFLIKKLESDEF